MKSSNDRDDDAALAARGRLVLNEAFKALGELEAKRYMVTRNFVMGGHTPAELARSEAGFR